MFNIKGNYKTLLYGVIGIVLAMGVYSVLASRGYVPSIWSSTPSVRDIDLGNGVIAKDVPVGVDVSLTNSSSSTQPSLSRKITTASSVSAEAAPIYKKKIEDAQAGLRKNTQSFDGWILLGTLYQQVGDYEGARQVFEYLSAIAPKNTVSFNNLGILYHYYLKDYPKAEANFLKAIENDPTYVMSYRNLFDLYSLSYKTNTTAAADIIKRGLKSNPNNQDLLNLQEQLKTK